MQPKGIINVLCQDLSLTLFSFLSFCLSLPQLTRSTPSPSLYPYSSLPLLLFTPGLHLCLLSN